MKKHGLLKEFNVMNKLSEFYEVGSSQGDDLTSAARSSRLTAAQYSPAYADSSPTNSLFKNSNFSLKSKGFKVKSKSPEVAQK